ncbi:MAG: DUF4388 domain-containing protein [Thermodesulfovibrionia bacterium]|nr:DUF4388 domain-containing protein [Thermodesulfovibrionia bacterium]
MTEQKLLIYSESPDGAGRFNDSLLENFKVVSSSNMLDTVNILKNDDIGMVLAVGDFNATEQDAFKSIVELLKPGINVMFIHPGNEANGYITLSGDDFCRYLRGAVTAESTLNDRLMVFKDFFMSFADRMLQIFGATNRYFFNMDHLIAHLSKKTALKLGLDEEAADNIQIAALLRDIGMLSIQQQLLEEKRKFSSTELTSLKKHPHNTVQILKQVKFPWNVDSAILQHHENYDGSGYPNGLKGRDICLGARIIHMADSYAAMTTERPHRMTLSHTEAKDEIIKHIGTQFDPEIAEKFLTVLEEEIRHESDKRSILVFEAQPNITTVMKLSVEMKDFNVFQATNTTEVIENVKHKIPDLTVVDVAMLDNETLISFFNTMYEMPPFENCPFMFVLTDPDFPKHFLGENVRYINMPIDMGHLRDEIKGLIGEDLEKPVEEEGEVRGLRGSLDDFNLPEIVQILQMGLKTARVDIKCNGHLGILHMKSGNIIQASTDNNEGQEAFFEMMAWPTGGFHILHGVQSEKNNINCETTYLLLESAKIIDDRNRLQ